MYGVKTVIVGDGGVGKTSLLVSYTSNTFPDQYTPTVFDNYSTVVSIDNIHVKVGLWDTAGQHEYDRLRPLLYPQTDIFIICFSVVLPYSFVNVKEKWVPEILRNARPDTIFFLVGLQIDLRTSLNVISSLKMLGEKPVTTLRGRRLAKEIGATQYMECSALTQEGVPELFDIAIRTALKNSESILPSNLLESANATQSKRHRRCTIQ